MGTNYIFVDNMFKLVQIQLGPIIREDSFICTSTSTMKSSGLDTPTTIVQPFLRFVESGFPFTHNEVYKDDTITAFALYSKSFITSRYVCKNSKYPVLRIFI